MKVLVTGGEHKGKEMAVAVVQVDGQISEWFSHYKMSGFLPPEQISPKHPNPMHNNGLLVVIEGDHCGKHVHQIHHQYEDGQSIVIVTVINWLEDGQVSLLGECEKQWNNGLMSGLHEEARKTRAKSDRYQV